jgi:N,N'-diacetyllegionaminate synthase
VPLRDTRFRNQLALPPNARGTGCIVIGEVAQTHDGSLGLAHSFVDAIADAGADAVKFQTHIAAAESTPAEPWRVKFSRQDATRFDYWKRMEFSEAQWAGLKQHAEDRGLLFLSSPFSHEAVELLTRLDIAAWKVASGEVSNRGLLDEMVRTRKPMLLSSGMSKLAELDTAVAVVREHGNALAVMQCTSIYPCPPEKVGIDVLAQYRERYHCPVGLSDHSGTIYPGLAAATLGCDVLEIHITLSREMFGPDVPSSITTTELRQLVAGVRFIETMRASDVDKDQMAVELSPLRDLFTKSVVARTDLAAGNVLRLDQLTTKKPGTGIAAARIDELVGRRLRRAVAADTLLSEADLEDV